MTYLIVSNNWALIGLGLDMFLVDCTWARQYFWLMLGLGRYVHMFSKLGWFRYTLARPDRLGPGTPVSEKLMEIIVGKGWCL